MKYLLPILLNAIAITAHADVATVAVASNFVPVFEKISARFEAETVHEVRLVGGASGKLYAQILRGAPFDLFLSADSDKPHKLIQAGHAQKTSLATYAIGQLALWSNLERSSQWKHRVASDVIAAGEFRRLSIANPAIAPYGLAAQQTLQSMDLYEELKPTLIVGENVSQVFHFLHSKNAELGFVSKAQVVSLAKEHQGFYWPIPNNLHSPIHQAMVLLGQQPSIAAITLHKFLQSVEVRDMIVHAGYSEFDS
ncbi:MAG: molybdate ABC transporter substrate-binding protein [Pseudomonadales bacterium]